MRRRSWAIRSARPSNGFTLIEIMVVLAIIGLIASAVAIGVFHQMKESKRKVARIAVRAVLDASARHLLNRQACPRSIADLVDEHELTRAQTKDPYGAEMTLKCPGEHDTDGVDIASAGPDGVFDTDDDVTSWER